MDLDTSSDRSSSSDIPTRPMRVKVLYSFDKDNKDNCLARFPNTLQIPAVAIDETSQVGVIELRQCIQSVVSASPELLSRLTDGDFTVYAYDYSEYDTPLVGQGMLSAAITATSPAPDGEKSMITGRICKNIPALFSNGVKETLEVKLRLVPISRPCQRVVDRKMEEVRSMSPATSAGFDPNAWNASMQQSRPQQQTNDYFSFSTASGAEGDDLSLIDEMLGLTPGNSGIASGQQTVGDVGMAQTPTDPTFVYDPAFSHSAPGSRAGSPMMGHQSGIQKNLTRHQSFSAHAPSFADQSRPASRANARDEVQSYNHQRHPSNLSTRPHSEAQHTEIHYDEDGQPRKRARVMQADWRGKSSFGAKRGDLRVTAATAHSVQMHRPVARRPGMAGSDLEPPPRVPTPVPHVNPMLQQHRLSQPSQSRSLLRQASTATMNSDLVSDADQFSDAMLSSPEDVSPEMSYTAEGTPQDIPSSPPVFAGFNAPERSSPGLPSLPQRALDSGYMSEPMFKNSSIDHLDDDEDRSPDAQDLEDAARYRPRSQQPGSFIKSEGFEANTMGFFPSELPQSEMNVEMETPGDMSQLPHKMLLDLPPGSQREHSQGPKLPKVSASRQPSYINMPASGNQDDLPSRPEPPQARRSSLALPPGPAPPASALRQPQANRPAAPTRRSMKRAYTDMDGSEAGSPAPSDTESRPRGSKRSGAGAQRRVIIQQRLEAAIATGNLPQYCTHCGAIETPTWRKLYVKYVDGKPSALDAAEGEGEIIAIEPVDTDQESGEVTRFMIRKSMKRTKESEDLIKDYEDKTVCNPCGLWFTKFRSMRPPDRWHRKTTSRKSKRQKSGDGTEGMMTDGPEQQSEAFFTDPVGPESFGGDTVLPEETQQVDTAATVTTNAPQAALRRPRASSMQPAPRRHSGGNGMTASQLNSALSRAVQSSPVRSHGSQASPIEIDDLTPKPVRRLLFPSPRREGEVKSLDDNGQSSLHATTMSGEEGQKPTSTKINVPVQNVDVNIFEAFTIDKENVAPDADFDVDFSHFFEGSPTNAFKTPQKTALKARTTTPRSQRRSAHLLKTPTPPSRKRQALSPKANAVTSGGQPAHDFMTSPSSSRYFLRSTPSRQDRTPARGSQHSAPGQGQEMTPFSRHLAQMLSDGNDPAASTSPSRGFDFSDLPTFMTPGRNLNDIDWDAIGDGVLSSEFAAFEDGKGGASNETEGEHASQSV